ncbi:MAG TPA: hypothetical protein VHS28_08565 [Chloroflexota bacterium]|nr:hypothetical protein [Chloroflexota bacterium]
MPRKRSDEEVRIEDEDEERVLTLKVSLEGPAELISWLRDNTPGRMGERAAGLLPEEFRQHMKAARHEQMLAMKSLFDAVLGGTERPERTHRPSTKVDVE